MRPLVVLPVALAAVVAVAAGVFVWRSVRPEDAAGSDTPASAEPRPAANDPDERLLEQAQWDLVNSEKNVGEQAQQLIARATKTLNELLERHRDDARFPFWRGVAAVTAHDEKGFPSYLGLVATRAPKGENTVMFRYLQALGYVEFRPEKADVALKILKAIRSEAPTFLPPMVERALFRALEAQAAKLGSDPLRAEEAGDYAREAVALARNDPPRRMLARRLLAQVYFRANDLVKAREEWTKLVDDTQGTVADFQMGLAAVDAKELNFNAAIPRYDKVIADIDAGKVRLSTAAVAEARMRRGNCLRELGKLDLARADLEQYAADNPGDDRVFHWLGRLFEDGFHDYQKARMNLEKAHIMAPWCENYLKYLIHFYQQSMPLPEEVTRLQKELDDPDKKKERAAEFEKRVKAHSDGVMLCE